jgi:hypothetical protein
MIAYFIRYDAQGDAMNFRHDKTGTTSVLIHLILISSLSFVNNEMNI